ncbi:ABC transporter B member 10 [Aphanomyces cochlioides]|nr:ABC transporter B member 10 [Aphanomyces cochlioides]
MWFTYAIGLWFGGWLVSKQIHPMSNPGSMLSTFYGTTMGSSAVGQVSPNINAMAAAKGAATSLFKILNAKSDIDASDMSGEIPATREGNIEARDVHFAYPSRPEDPILRGYSLTIKKSETVAFVGASGSGKSTLVALLERFYQPTSGAIYLDGRDISTLQLKWLRSQIGLVSQEPVLFATTISENIAAGGENISRDQVIAAAKLANAHDFIMGLPDGYDTMCGEKGATLSGGQKQRVAIARALVRLPNILVLDEATSALDNESELVVQEALNNLIAHTDMTTIVIAHRLSTIRTADKIAVISKGVVVELGRHEDLMRLEDGFYRSLVEQQSNAPTDEGVSRVVEEYEGRVYMALEDEPEKALSDRKYSSASPASIDKLECVDTVNKEVKLGRIFELTKPQRFHYVFGVIASCLLGFSTPAISLIISKVISGMNLHYADYLQSGKKDMTPLTALYDDVSHSAYIFIGIAAAVLVASYIQAYSFRVMAEKLTSRLRNMHYQALMRQDIGFFDLPGHTTGALTTDLATHATKVVVIAGESQARILQASFTVIAAFLIAFFWGNWKLALVAAAVFPLLILGSFASILQFNGDNFVDNLADSGAIASESITNTRTVSAFGLLDDFLVRYEVLLDIPLKGGIKQGQIFGLLNGFSGFIMLAVYALVFWYGAHLMNDRSISFKELMNTLMAFMMATPGVNQTAAFIRDTDAAKKSAAKIFSIVDPYKFTGRIEFKDVFFNYPSRPDVKVLRHYDLTIEPGQTVAFCGPSGGGKSTCVALLERFYNPTLGSITLDGRDISTLNLHWLRSQIGLVGQEPVLFVGTIAENIASGISDYTSLPDLQERVEEAAKMANAHNFIMQFPDGYQTQVGLKGEQLSGGQKQRIAIARAIMKNPSILLLDEATSALDSESEKDVEEALDKLLAAKGRTTIVIAHRLSTIRNADKICVVSGGRIAKQGTHDELMKLNGIYTRLVQPNKKIG